MSKLDDYAKSQEKLYAQSDAKANAKKRVVAEFLSEFWEKNLKTSSVLQNAGVDVHFENGNVALSLGTKIYTFTPAENGVFCSKSSTGHVKVIPLRSLKVSDREECEKTLIKLIWEEFLKSEWKAV